MTQDIGQTAGEVWNYLSQNGEATLAQMARKTGCPRNMVERAVGWLAREDKLTIERMGRVEKIRLKQGMA